MALPKWITAPFSTPTSDTTSVPTSAPVGGAPVPPQGLSKIGSLRRMIDLGQGPARGFSARTRTEALRGIEIMRVRSPRMLGDIAAEPTPGAVSDLIQYARERAAVRA